MIESFFLYGAYKLSGLFVRDNILFMIAIFLCLIMIYTLAKLERKK